jgi:O-antigen/teichoic acid export membrane protein
MYIAGSCVTIRMLNSIQIYQFIRFGTTLFAFWVLSRIFPTEQVGMVEKTLLVANISTFFWLQTVQTHFLKKNTFSYYHYATFIVYASVCISIGILIYSFWNSQYVFSGLYVLFYPFGTLLEMYWIAQKKSKMLVRYSIIFYGIWTATVALTTYFSHSLFWVYTVWILVLLMRTIFCAVYIPFRFVKLNSSFFNSLVWLMLTFLVAGSAEYIDGFLTDALFGKSQLAQFRYGAREIPIFLILANSLSLWITQIIAQNHTENFNQILGQVRRKSSQYLIFSTGISALLVLVSTPVYRYVYGVAYVSASMVFDIILLLVVSRFIFSNSILLGLGLDKIQFRIACIELVINVILSVAGAYFWGIYGIAAATVIAYFMEKVFLAIYLYRKKGINPASYIPIYLVIVCYLLLLSILGIKYSSVYSF